MQSIKKIYITRVSYIVGNFNYNEIKCKITA